jgi:hypothetical protein
VTFSEAARTHFSTRALGIAYAAGALPSLEALEESMALGGSEGASRGRARTEQITRQLQIAHQQAAALEAELDCEGERAAQLREFMEEREARGVRTLTVASITAGGASAVATALLGRYAAGSVAEMVVGIAGGLSSAGLGLGIFFVRERRRFNHERNLLAEIWQGPARSDVYPPVVWYYLTQREFSNTGVRSIRENVVARWSRFEHVSREAAAERARRERLLFGHGGVYSADDLAIRVALLEQTRAAVALLDQEIDRLQREVASRVGSSPEAEH